MALRALDASSALQETERMMALRAAGIILIGTPRDRLMRASRRPTAIFASNDAIALGAMDRMRGMSLRVPEDVSIIGFDDVPAASAESYALSTLRQDAEALARAAVAALRALAYDDRRRATHVVLPVELVLRGSSSPLR